MKNNTQIMKSAFTCLCLGMLLGCGMLDGDSRNGGRVISNKAKLEQKSSAAAKKAEYISGNLALSKTEVNIESQTINGQYRSSPNNLSGDLCFAFLSLGDLGPGMFPMTWLAPSESFPDGPSSGSCSTIKFDLSDPEIIVGKLKIPESSGDMPARKEIIRAELNFNYVDASIEVGEGDSALSYVIRTVYTSAYTAEDVSGTMYLGDKLIRLPSEDKFRWANSEGTSFNRDSVATGIFRDNTVTEVVHGDGNQDYVPVTANFPTEVTVDYGMLADTSKVWTLSFELANAIVWSADPNTFTSPQDLVKNFRLKFGPNRSTTYGEADDGIRSQLSID